jgi:predicted Zn-dependent peptidase
MYDDQPPFGADDKCKLAHFGAHPLSKSVLGTEQSVSRLSAEQMLAYFRQRYSPGNMLLAGAGKIDFDLLVNQAQRLCGNWQPADAPRPLPEVQPSSGLQVLTRESASQEYVLQMLRGPTATDEDRFAAKLMAMIVGDDSGSRLYWELVDPGRAEQASLGHYEYDGAGVFMSYMSCDPELAADNYDRMLGVFREAESGGLSAEELLQAKSKLSSRVVLGSERPRSRLFSVGGNWMQRQEYRSVKDDLDAVTRVTLEEVHAVLEKYPLSVNTTIAIGPLTELV